MNNNSSAALEEISQFVTDYIEIGYHAVLIIIGVPINVRSFMRQHKAYKSSSQIHQQEIKSQFLLQKIHLNAANLLSLIAICPVQLSWLITYQWLAGEAACKLTLFSWIFVMSASSNIVAVIAIERLRNVVILENLWSVRKSSKRQRIRASKFMKHFLLICWAVSLLCSLPQLLFWTVIELTPNFYQCTTVWKSPENGEQYSKFSKSLYNLFHLSTTFWIPFLVVAVCYISIAIKLLKFSCSPLKRNFTSRRKALKRKKLRNDELPRAEPRLSKRDDGFDRDNTEEIKGSLGRGTMRKSADGSLMPHSTLNVAESPLIFKSKRKFASTANPANPFASSNDFEKYTAFRATENAAKPLLPEIVGIPSWRLQMRSRIFRTTGLLVLVYAVFWLPYNILGIILLIDENLLVQLENHMYCTKSLMLLPAVLNPLLYGW